MAKLKKSDTHSPSPSNAKTIAAGAAGLISGAVLASVKRQSEVGTLNANINLYSYPKAYIKITRPKAYNPNELSKMKGQPSNSFTVLGNISGYTVVDEIKLKSTCTSKEADMIKSLLKKGVIL